MAVYSLIIIFCVSFLILVSLYLLNSKEGVENSLEQHPETVGKFYNETTDKFLEVYGEIIQAFRTKDVDSYLNYTAKNMRLANGMKLIDAGCGVAGPAMHFAELFKDIAIDACSISEVQIEKASQNILNKNLGAKINTTLCDYHYLDKNFNLNSYDRVYFLESYGHSQDKKKLLDAAWEVLKPGGMVYIKDLFAREVEGEWEQHYIDKICEDINEAYKYHIGSLYETLSILRKKGYLLHFVKIPEVNEDEFENLSISNDFQNLFNIGKIESWDNYVFPIDFFEILAEKPRFSCFHASFPRFSRS